MATATTFAEMNSFIWKFSHLSSMGFNTDIKFRSVNGGKVSVNLTAELGTLFYPFPPTKSSIKPSRRNKRRRRRNRARSQQEATAVVNSTNNYEVYNTTPTTADHDHDHD